MSATEGIHGVDWLVNRSNSPREHHHRSHAPSSPGLAKDVPPRTSSHGGLPVQPPTPPTPSAKSSQVIPDGPTQQTPPLSSPLLRSPLKRPGIMSRTTSDKSTPSAPSDGSGRSSLRRGSWISNLSSKFGGSQQSHQSFMNPNGSPKSPPPPQNGANPAEMQALAGVVSQQSHLSKEGVAHKSRMTEESEPYVPAHPKPNTSSFFSNALRRLSSSSQTSSTGKLVSNGGVCPRRVMNIDENRERCRMPELDQNKLRKVAFCVDVEIAGGPRYKDDPPVDNKKKSKDKKLKEKGEGAALKNPQAAADAKDKCEAATEDFFKDDATAGAAPDDEPSASSKKDKKKRTDEEKRERAEKKRRKAEESGSVPKELSRDSEAHSPPLSGPVGPKPQDKPTTNPLRIYRRCCQLRETPILKRITEQLAHPRACSAATPGIVEFLDLTGSRLQLPDVVALSDWLAVVPVKRLLLEDADLTDEGVRVVLAGLLAAKPPDQQRSNRRLRRTLSNTQQDSAEHGDAFLFQRLGLVEKLSLKNNPRLTATAWKYVSLFIYMCRSIKALDMSMNSFPNVQMVQTDSQSKPTPKVGTLDMSEVFSKAISERLAGSHLEELMMAECALSSHTIRKIIGAVIVSGISRLGLAGNSIDNEGLDAVVHYLRSGICQGLDLAGNDLRGKTSKLVQGMHHEIPLWALSLAGCNLDVESLKMLCPSMVCLHNLRFIDLSHNHDLFSKSPDAVPLLRRYIPQWPLMKRIHLSDVSMEPRQAIGLAEVLPEAPHLAHFNILNNPALARLASATEENDLEEACALYASMMSAARTSESLIAIDIDVPTQETSELVKALAKQIVAYCLRNMERFAAAAETPEVLEMMSSSTDAQSASTNASAGATELSKDIDTPAVLMHLVGHVDDHQDRPGDDDPAPDDDYVVGGTGIVKALTYCLREKASDIKRDSIPGSGYNSPSRRKAEAESGAKAKKLGKDLLGSARKIRCRIQPAMMREAEAGNDMNYRRLQFLDQTLQQTIDRFEAEYPEMRPRQITVSASPALSSGLSPETPRTSSSTEDVNTPAGKDSEFLANATEDSDEEDIDSPGQRSRHASDVSLAGKMMGFEEGKMHRIGQKIRKDILAPSSNSLTPANAGEATSSVMEDGEEGVAREEPAQPSLEEIEELRRKLEELQGAELRQKVKEVGWEEVIRRVGHSVEELKKLREVAERGGLGSEEERDWRKFREAQEIARANVES